LVTSVRELRIRTLAGILAVAAVLSWAGAGLLDSFGRLPGVPVAAPVVLALIATVLLATSLSLRNRLRAQRRRVPGAKGVDPMMAARALVFGQASALVAALVAGLYGGTGVFLLLNDLDLPARREQALVAGLSVLAGVAVVAAAKFLEHVCRLPDDDGDDDPAAAAAG
jgi:phosphatidylglycerophosphate synthase